MVGRTEDRIRLNPREVLFSSCGEPRIPVDDNPVSQDLERIERPADTKVRWSVSNIDVISNHLKQSRWKEFAEKTLAFLAFVLAYLFAVIGSQALVYEAFSSAPFYASAQATTFLMANAVMFGLFFYHHCKTRDQWINNEAQKFLAARSSQDNALLSTWRKKLRRGMVWGPTVFVLGAFLFFPELLGIVSHLPGQPSLDHYRLEIPLTWIVADNSSSYVDSRLVGSQIWIVAGQGIGRVGLAAYWRREEPVSEMTFSYAPYNPNDVWLPAHPKVLSTREVPFGKEVLICWDIIPYPDTRPRPIDPAFAEIICPAGKDGFRAHFSGWRTDSAMFYRALQRVIRKP